MKLMIAVLSLFAASTARAELTARVPDVISFADVCEYKTFGATLTCLDSGGNHLFDDAKVYRVTQFLAYPTLPIFALMKQKGFNLVSDRGDYGDRIVTFYRNAPSC